MINYFFLNNILKLFFFFIIFTEIAILLVYLQYDVYLMI